MAMESANRSEGAVQTAVVTTVAKANRLDAAAQAKMVTTVCGGSICTAACSASGECETRRGRDAGKTAMEGGIERESGSQAMAVSDGDRRVTRSWMEFGRWRTCARWTVLV